MNIGRTRPVGQRRGGEVRISRSEFAQLQALMHEWTGVRVADKKYAWMESRLARRIQVLGVDSYSEYIHRIHLDPSERERFINALTTNKTDFFRETEHFAFLARQGVPKLLERRPEGPLYFWSAACSSGEEVYSLAMTLNEAASPRPFGYRILGTDIDTGMLSIAERAVYPVDTVRKQVPPHLLARYFRQGTGENLGLCRIGPELKSFVKFRRHNLIQGELGTGIRFDAIFLRNVMIYFKVSTIQAVINRIVPRLRPGGYLFVAHCETLSGIEHPLRQLESSIYVKER